MDISHHLTFAEKIKHLLLADDRILGLALGGSWINNELDEFSDLDFYIVLDADLENLNFEEKKELIAGAGKIVSCYINAHDNNVMTTLFDLSPQLLHVDFKWIYPIGFHDRVEDPEILIDKKGILKQIILQFPSKGYPVPDLQWHESRFWTWIHYILAKIGRGEILESINYLDEVRSCCIGPILLHKNNLPPRRLRRAEKLPKNEYNLLLNTFPLFRTADACYEATMKMVELHKYLIAVMAKDGFVRSFEAEIACLKYAAYVKNNFIKKK